jgi:hypothetical protein
MQGALIDQIRADKLRQEAQHAREIGDVDEAAKLDAEAEQLEADATAEYDKWSIANDLIPPTGPRPMPIGPDGPDGGGGPVLPIAGVVQSHLGTQGQAGGGLGPVGPWGDFGAAAAPTFSSNPAVVRTMANAGSTAGGGGRDAGDWGGGSGGGGGAGVPLNLGDPAPDQWKVGSLGGAHRIFRL